MVIENCKKIEPVVVKLRSKTKYTTFFLNTVYIYRTSYSRRMESCMARISLPLQMAERLLRAQPVSVANHAKARRSLIERSVT